MKGKRILAWLLSVVMLAGMFPTAAFAVEEGPPCENHPEHTAGCGYVEAVPCGHTEHTAACYTDELICGQEEGGEQTASGNDAAHQHVQECYKLDCPHKRGEHDDTCGYVEGAACAHTCELCAPKDSGPVPGTSGQNVQKSTPSNANENGLPPANEGLVKRITGWAFVDGDNLSGGVLPLPGVSMGNQTDFDTVAGMLPTRIEAELDGETAPATLDITGWTCEAFQQEEGNWPVTGTYIFTAVLPEGYALAPDAAALEVPVMLGGANVLEGTGAFTVSGGTYDDDYTYKDNTLIIKSGTELTIANKNPNEATTDKIKVDNDVTANITLDGVNIDVSGTFQACALDLSEAGKSTITLVGNSTLKSGGESPGIYVPKSQQVTISGDGELEVHGGANWPGIGRDGDGDIKIEGGTITAFGGSSTGAGAAGIGGSNKKTGGTIEITDGIVKATGGNNGAGIGGGNYSSGGNITISGGTVNATSNGEGAGIGGGAGKGGDKIIISGGTVDATGGTDGAGIGGGTKGAGGTITISGSANVTATGKDGGAGIGGGNKGASGNITISDSADVTATGGSSGAGIGSGVGSGKNYGCTDNDGKITITGGTVKASGGTSESSSGCGAGIGGGGYTAGGTVEISGSAYVIATGGSTEGDYKDFNGGAGIGGGGGAIYYKGGTGGDITIDGNTVVIATGKGKAAHIGAGSNASGDTKNPNLNKGVIFEGNTGTVYGSPELPGDLEMPENSTLSVSNSSTLTVPVSSSLSVSKGSTLTVSEGATLTNSGEVKGEGTLTGDGTFGGNGIYTLKVARSIDAPAQNSVTADSVELKTVNAPKGGGAVTYGYATNNDSGQVENWQSELSFSDLAPGTDYYFFARVAANGAYQQATSTDTKIQTLVASIDIQAIPGVTAPARGASPVVEITETDQYTGTVEWKPTISGGGKFAADTEYTATITLSPKKGYTLDGVTENYFTVADATTVSNSANSGEVKAVFPKTEEAPIDIQAIPGVTAPVLGASPVAAITETDQYTGTVAWSPTIAAGGKFAADTVYEATITLSPKKGYTLDGVTENYFTVADATTVSNSANSGKVKAVFPETAAATYTIVVDNNSLNFGSMTVGYAAAPAAQTVKITNTGNQEVTITLPSATGYTVTATGTGWGSGEATLAPNGEASFTVQPKTGLTEGEHTGKLTISTGHGTSATVDLSFTVTAEPTYSVTVTGGTGGGSYKKGEPVSISATIPGGQRFTGWTISPEVSFTGGTGVNSNPATFTMPAQAVTVTARFENIPTGGGGGGGSGDDGDGGSSGPTYYRRTLTTGGVKVSGGSIHNSAALTVQPWAFHSAGDAGCDLLRAAQETGRVLGAWDVSLSRGFQGRVTVSLPVNDREGQSLTVAHCVGGKLTLSNAKVSGRFAAVETDSLSPFAVLDGVFTQADLEALAAPKNPSTGDSPFTDVKETDWFYQAVMSVYQRGLMKGTGPDTFSPQGAVTRAMPPVILYRLEGSPAVTAQNPFADVLPGQWYTGGVTWAAGNGLVSGYDGKTYGPGDPLTREQLVTLLYRYAQYKKWDVSGAGGLSAYTDAGEVSEWAREAMAWAVSSGILQGNGGKLMPKAGATRAQLAQMLQRLLDKYGQPALPAKLPADEKKARRYRVQTGDTLSALARKYNCTVAELVAANPIIKNPNFILPGWEIDIP